MALKSGSRFLRLLEKCADGLAPIDVQITKAMPLLTDKMASEMESMTNLIQSSTAETNESVQALNTAVILALRETRP